MPSVRESSRCSCSARNTIARSFSSDCRQKRADKRNCRAGGYRVVFLRTKQKKILLFRKSSALLYF